MKKKEQSIKYTYYRWDEELKKEVPVVITLGNDGVTQEHIIWLENFDHDEQLQERYVEENSDYSTDNKKMKLQRGGDGVVGDPIEELSTNKTDPYFMLNGDKPINPQVELLLQLMVKLTPQQIDTIYSHYGERKYLADIAREDGCSTQAINNRKNKIIARLKKLFAELDKQ